MMVITVGVSVLLLGTVLLQETRGRDQREEALQDFAQDLSARILAEREMLQEEGVLRSSCLYLLAEMSVPIPGEVTGYQVRLAMVDRPEEVRTILVHGLVPEEVSLLVSVRTPIGLSLSLNEVRPAMLEVLVW